MTPNDFIDRIAPDAKTCAAKTGIPASFTVAQAALESGWGVHTPGNNLFGVKTTPDWKGASTSQTTHEVVDGKTITIVAKFRAYDSWLDSINDHARFLLTNKRYQSAFSCTTGVLFARAVQICGYATDPQYAAKVCALIKAHGLDALDQIPA